MLLHSRTKAVVFLAIFSIFIIFSSASALILIPSGTISGYVKNSLDNSPMSNIQIKIDTGVYSEYITTDNNGYYQYDTTGICSTGINISIDVNGFYPYSEDVYVSCFGDKTYNIYLTPQSTSAVNPLIIIPGIAGSELYHNNEEIWINVSEAITDLDDSFLNVLTMNISGESVENIDAEDMIREKKFIVKKIFWTRLIDDLTSDGYAEDINMFVFPYDWRYGNSKTADELKDKIDEILNQTGANKVDIIAHSMGGLVTKKYIEKYGENKVDQIIFMGTPHYGAAKSLKVLLFGDNLGIPVISTERIRVISRNFPSMYELLPSRKYFDVYGGYVLDIVDVDGDGIVGALDFDETSSFISNMNLNSNLYSQAIVFHNNVDSLSMSPALQSRIHNIVGCSQATIGRIISAGYKKNKEAKWKVWMVDGDETVPLKSAQGTVKKAEYFVPQARHSRMPDNITIRNLIIDILDDNNVDLSNPQYGDIKDGQKNCSFSGYLISIHSPVEIVAYDSQGRHTGPDQNGNINTDIPGSEYFEIGDNKFIYIPDNSSVDIFYKGTDTGNWQIAISKINEQGILQSANFIDQQTNPKMTGKTTITPQTDLSYTTIKLDNDGDGIYEEVKNPDSVLQGDKAEDITPPQIIIQSPLNNKQYLNSQKINFRYNVIDKESGIFSQKAYLDKSEITDSKIDLRLLKTGIHKIKIEAYDKAGNYAEKNISFDVYTTLTALQSNLDYYSQKWIHRLSTYFKLKSILKHIDILEKVKEKLEEKSQNMHPLSKSKLEKQIQKIDKSISKQYNKFIKEVKRQKGKNIDESAADLLIDQAEYLKER